MPQIYTRFKKSIALILSFAIAFTSSLPLTAQAQSCSAADADRGTSPNCAAVRIGGVPVPYPKLQWRKLTEMPVAPQAGSTTVLGGDEVVSLANRTAKKLNLQAHEIANIVTAFPSNVPFVFSRFNPMDNTLHVDIFKIEKSVEGGVLKAGLYHSPFTPAHGEMWKAARSYITPAQFKTGNTPGVNPFASFRSGDSETFYNITMTGAQVAVGHAMRAAGAPTALMAVAQPRLSKREHTSSGWFWRKQEVWVYGHARPTWFMAQPTSVLERTGVMYASICASDPTRTSCQKFETAVSGVSFEQIDGGVFDSFEDTWQLDYKSNEGLSFLGALVLGIIGSFAMAAIMAGAFTGMGTMGTLLTNMGVSTSIGSSLGMAVAIEGAVVAAGLFLGGATLDSAINYGPEVLLGYGQVAKGFESPASLSDYQNRLNSQISARTSGPLASGQSLSATNSVLTGGCALGSRGCGTAGAVPRVEDFREQNGLQFMRDNDGSSLR